MGYGELVALLRTTNKFASVLSAIFSLVFTAAQGYASVSLTGRGGDGSDKQGTTVRRPGPRLTSNSSSPSPLQRQVLKIAEMLNAETRRKALLRARKRRLKLVSAYVETRGIPTDHIVMHQVEFSHGPERLRLPPLSLDIAPETLVALKSNMPVGKTTLLKLLARMYLPTEGFIVYPERWRVRYVLLLLLLLLLVLLLLLLL